MRRVSSGFTLVEMLVVTAIIVVLAAIAVPVFETAIKRAERVSCLSNMRNLGTAANLYADDYDDQYPPARSAPPTVYLGTCWDVTLYDYFRNEEMLKCPSDQAPNFASGYTCYVHSYGTNWDITMLNGTTGLALNRAAIERPDDTILFFEIKGSTRATGCDYDIHRMSRVDERHAGGANYAFCDGTAKWLRPEQTTAPVNRWHP